MANHIRKQSIARVDCGQRDRSNGNRRTYKRLVDEIISNLFHLYIQMKINEFGYPELFTFKLRDLNKFE